jgi:hypothetical protein
MRSNRALRNRLPNSFAVSFTTPLYPKFDGNPLTFCEWGGYNVNMLDKTSRAGYKLGEILRRHPTLLHELREQREQGASWYQLVFYVYDKTGFRVNPITIRDWFQKWKTPDEYPKV